MTNIQKRETREWAIADEILKDPMLASDIDVIGVHYPLVNGRITTTEAARRTGKPLWSSEDQPNSGSGPYLSRDWPDGGKILAHLYNQNYLEGSLTATEIWSPITSYYDNLAAPNSGLMYANTPWSGHYNVQAAIWATAHTTQFVQPGWQYLDSSSGKLPINGSYVTLRSPDHKNWSAVIETVGATTPQAVRFKIESGLAQSDVYVWQTNETHIFERVAVIHPADGLFAYTFDPESLYSLDNYDWTRQGYCDATAVATLSQTLQRELRHCRYKSLAQIFFPIKTASFEVHACVGRPAQR